MNGHEFPVNKKIRHDNTYGLVSAEDAESVLILTEGESARAFALAACDEFVDANQENASTSTHDNIEQDETVTTTIDTSLEVDDNDAESLPSLVSV
nr:2459_t:CDS:2 [Entrophospora candida]